METLVDKVKRKEERQRKWRKFRNISLVVIIVGLFIAGGIYYYFPFGEGVKSGQLNNVVYKGVIFKTYEGKLIQSGLRSKNGLIQSNEFVFSVSNKELAEKLMLAGGEVVELHYVEYFGALPWRGFSRFVVDSIVSTSETRQNVIPSVNIPSQGM